MKTPIVVTVVVISAFISGYSVNEAKNIKRIIDLENTIERFDAAILGIPYKSYFEACSRSLAKCPQCWTNPLEDNK